MSLHEIAQHVTSLPDVTSADNFGYRFFFFATDQVFPFVTLAESDNEYDNVSRLSRDGIYRVNIGVTKETYRKLFLEAKPQWDYSELNRFMPHPQYAAQNFICVLNPTDSTLTQTLQYIDEAYTLARTRFLKKKG